MAGGLFPPPPNRNTSSAQKLWTESDRVIEIERFAQAYAKLITYGTSHRSVAYRWLWKQAHLGKGNWGTIIYNSWGFGGVRSVKNFLFPRQV
jgi:hypothetical protein